MIVADIFLPIRKVLGFCDEEETYAKINEAIEELANLGNWDPLTMYLDICTQGCDITLPDDVEVPLAVNVGGRPTDFRNKWFEFHMNGPGTECCGQSCGFGWQDRGNFPTFRDIHTATTLTAYPVVSEDIGKVLRIYGYDITDNWIMTPDVNGVLQDGFPAIVDGLSRTQVVKRITRVSKPVSVNFIHLFANDGGEPYGQTLMGVYRPSETEPNYRRLRVNGAGCACLCSTNSTSTWVRMRVRKKVFTVSTLQDYIPLHSITALKFMVMAIKKYEADLLTEYAGYFNAAKEALQREQKTRSGPNQIKIQFQGGSYAGRPGENMV